jgi:hypothetical protein
MVNIRMRPREKVSSECESRGSDHMRKETEEGRRKNGDRRIRTEGSGQENGDRRMGGEE